MVSGPLVWIRAQLTKAPGNPVKARVQPTKEGFVPNTERKSNPFSMDSEPDWIPISGLTRSSARNSVDRKPVPPPRHGTFDGVVSVEPGAAVGKSPPAVPRKPLSLSSQTAPSTPLSASRQSISTGQSGSRPPGPGNSGAVDLLGDADSETIEWKPLVPQ